MNPENASGEKEPMSKEERLLKKKLSTHQIDIFIIGFVYRETMDKKRTLFIIFFLLVITVCVHIAGATPISSFSENIAGGPPPLTVHFTDTSSGNPNCWQWDFGDGSTSILQNPTHVYNSNGIYTTSLSAGDNGNYSSTFQKTVYVRTFMVASYSVNPTSGIAPLTIYLTDTSTGNPNQWRWQVQKGGGGDPPPSNEQNPTFTLTRPGQYGVYLQVGDTNFPGPGI